MTPRCIFLLVVMLTAGCGADLVNVARQALIAGTEAVVAVDRVVSKVAPAELDAIGARIRDEARQAKADYDVCREAVSIDCGPPPTADMFMARYAEQTRGWGMAVHGTALLREGLVLGDVAVRTWSETKVAPTADLTRLCTLVVEGAQEVTAGLVLAKAPVPSELDKAQRLLGGACDTLNVEAP